nr:immunoglobulin light chain junction region [Macaca mulatta]
CMQALAFPPFTF